MFEMQAMLLSSGSQTNATGITAEMIEPILDGITANIAVIMPVGIAVMGIMIGISLVPRLIKKFTKG